jgi:hypothetical protein
VNLKESLKIASEKVWAEMAPVSSRFFINQVREDGLTSMILKVLARAKCVEILNIIESPKQGKMSEKYLGYDFDLWIGTNNKYVRYIIQAKSQRGGYSLNSNYKIDGTQLARLERFAIKQEKIGVPLFSFYKHLQVADNEIAKFYNSNEPFLKELMGITLSSTTKVKKFDSISFKDLHAFHEKIDQWIPLFERNVEDIKFYNELLNATVPWHELGNFKISTVEKVNKAFKKIKKLGQLNLLLLLPSFFDFGGELIPIHKMTPAQIISYCFKQNFEDDLKTYEPIQDNFQGKALVIIDCKE